MLRKELAQEAFPTWEYETSCLTRFLLPLELLVGVVRVCLDEVPARRPSGVGSGGEREKNTMDQECRAKEVGRGEANRTQQGRASETRRRQGEKTEQNGGKQSSQTQEKGQWGSAHKQRRLKRIQVCPQMFHGNTCCVEVFRLSKGFLTPHALPSGDILAIIRVMNRHVPQRSIVVFQAPEIPVRLTHGRSCFASERDTRKPRTAQENTLR